ncbi:MAG: hypothetical protein JJE34_10325 [Alphaproteobacteria bacterium]|nr:hypothetical protein [Alphaproteobacteria bacterium]
MRPILITLPVLLAACATSGMAEDKPPALTEKQQAALDKALEGKVAGKPRSCISLTQRADLQVISDDLLLYKAGRTVYLNRVNGRCNGLSFGGTLVTNVWGSQLCRGDIARVADLQVGMITGSCALGDFVSYTSPAK